MTATPPPPATPTAPTKTPDFFAAPGAFVHSLMQHLASQGMHSLTATYDDKTGDITLAGTVATNRKTS